MKEKKIFFILKIIEKWLNRLKLREKIVGLFIFCVIVPIICTDGFILRWLYTTEKAEEKKEAEEVLETVANLYSDIFTDCERISTSVSVNDNIGDFLGRNYENAFDYYDNYHMISSNFFFQTLVGFDNTKVKLYTSNDTVINGGYVGTINTIYDTDWYNYFIDSGKNTMILCYYDETKSSLESKRSIYYMKKLKFYNNEYENFIRIELDYSTITRKLSRLGDGKIIYVCDDEDNILLNNIGTNKINEHFEKFNEQNRVVAQNHFESNGNLRKVYVLENDLLTIDILKANLLWLIAIVLVNFLLPALVLIEIDYSIIHRIKKLDQVFGRRENDRLVKIEDPEGSDEIGNLMINYNRMADRVNQLIQIVYKDKLREQEITLAKKNAELLALHSQINPHFMFNALESIRMHSVIKGEMETAEMVERLALMERQYVDWDSDMIEITREMSSVEAYLGLQKYRFGDKLHYELSVEEECEHKKIPKLTIVTFVENACVHGMENKETECFVFVRVYNEDDKIIIEVEDTGNGMDEDVLKSINEKAKTIEMDDMKALNHVGIYNALLRLKMTMGNDFEFEIESEEGVGTMIQISIPLN